jgi:hypothetical protein
MSPLTRALRSATPGRLTELETLYKELHVHFELPMLAAAGAWLSPERAATPEGDAR